MFKTFVGKDMKNYKIWVKENATQAEIAQQLEDKQRLGQVDLSKQLSMFDNFLDKEQQSQQEIEIEQQQKRVDIQKQEQKDNKEKQQQEEIDSQMMEEMNDKIFWAQDSSMLQVPEIYRRYSLQARITTFMGNKNWTSNLKMTALVKNLKFHRFQNNVYEDANIMKIVNEFIDIQCNQQVGLKFCIKFVLDCSIQNYKDTVKIFYDFMVSQLAKITSFRYASTLTDLKFIYIVGEQQVIGYVCCKTITPEPKPYWLFNLKIVQQFNEDNYFNDYKDMNKILIESLKKVPYFLLLGTNIELWQSRQKEKAKIRAIQKDIKEEHLKNRFDSMTITLGQALNKYITRFFYEERFINMPPMIFPQVMYYYVGAYINHIIEVNPTKCYEDVIIIIMNPLQDVINDLISFFRSMNHQYFKKNPGKFDIFELTQLIYGFCIFMQQTKMNMTCWVGFNGVLGVKIIRKEYFENTLIRVFQLNDLMKILNLKSKKAQTFKQRRNKQCITGQPNPRIIHDMVQVLKEKSIELMLIIPSLYDAEMLTKKDFNNNFQTVLMLSQSHRLILEKHKEAHNQQLQDRGSEIKKLEEKNMPYEEILEELEIKDYSEKNIPLALQLTQHDPKLIGKHLILGANFKEKGCDPIKYQFYIHEQEEERKKRTVFDQEQMNELLTFLKDENSKGNFVLLNQMHCIKRITLDKELAEKLNITWQYQLPVVMLPKNYQEELDQWFTKYEITRPRSASGLLLSHYLETEANFIHDWQLNAKGESKRNVWKIMTRNIISAYLKNTYENVKEQIFFLETLIDIGIQNAPNTELKEIFKSFSKSIIDIMFLIDNIQTIRQKINPEFLNEYNEFSSLLQLKPSVLQKDTKISNKDKFRQHLFPRPEIFNTKIMKFGINPTDPENPQVWTAYTDVKGALTTTWVETQKELPMTLDVLQTVWTWPIKKPNTSVLDAQQTNMPIEESEWNRYKRQLKNELIQDLNDNKVRSRFDYMKILVLKWWHTSQGRRKNRQNIIVRKEMKNQIKLKEALRMNEEQEKELRCDEPADMFEKQEALCEIDNKQERSFQIQKIISVHVDGRQKEEDQFKFNLNIDRDYPFSQLADEFMLFEDGPQNKKQEKQEKQSQNFEEPPKEKRICRRRKRH